MEERGGVLVQNEKHANKSVAKVMRITFLIFSIVFLLNVLGIFVVDMKIMAIAYILGSILLWAPTIIVKYLSEGRHDDSSGHVAERYKACSFGNCNVCCDLSYYG